MSPTTDSEAAGVLYTLQQAGCFGVDKSILRCWQVFCFVACVGSVHLVLNTVSGFKPKELRRTKRRSQRKRMDTEALGVDMPGLQVPSGLGQSGSNVDLAAFCEGMLGLEFVFANEFGCSERNH